MTRLIDFDAIRERADPEPLTLRIGGQEYQLPGEMPAVLALDVIELRARLGDEALPPPEDARRLALGLFGEELLETLVTEHRLSLNELVELVVMVMHQYGTGHPGATLEAGIFGAMQPPAEA